MADRPGSTRGIGPHEALRLALVALIGFGLVVIGLDVWSISSIRRARPVVRRAPLRPIGRGLFASPHLIALADGSLIGWWLSGMGPSERLTIVRVAGSVRVQKTLRLAQPGSNFQVNGSALIAADDRGHLVIAWRRFNRRQNLDELVVAAWNPRLAGAPQVRVVSSQPLISGGRAIDFGPDPQSLQYESYARVFMLAGDEVRPWSEPMPYPNRPRLDLSLISPAGELLASRRLDLSPAESFIDPLVRLSDDRDGYALAMIRPGDSVGDGPPQPDTIWLWRLNRALTPVGPPRTVASSQADGALIDLALAYSRRHLFLVWEAQDPEVNQVESKHVWGRLFDPQEAGRPFLISNLVAAATQVPANLQLAGDRDGFLLSWDPGNGIIAGRMSLSGGNTTWRWRWLFPLRHVLYLQPALASVIDRGQVSAIWQDPGSAQSPGQIGDAPVELARAPLG
jgi:hypothetical protein